MLSPDWSVCEIVASDWSIPVWTPLWSMRVAFKHRLANEVCEVEAVADQGAPAEQVGQTQPPEPLIALILINNY